MKLIDFYNTCLSYSYVSISDAFELINHFFNVKKEEFIFNTNKEIDEDKANEIISKITRGVPISYILGYVYFCNLKIKVNKNVLIPRIETEELVNYIYDNFDLNNKKLLDLCTGSGAIALALKNKFKESEVYASDISEKALKVAKENSKKNNLKINLIESNYLEKIKEKFDFIVSNPPYIPLKEKVDAKYEPRIALFSKDDGCFSYKEIFKDIQNNIKKEGVVLLEIEPKNVEKIIKIIKDETKNIKEVSVIKDLEQKDRFIKVNFK